MLISVACQRNWSTVSIQVFQIFRKYHFKCIVIYRIEYTADQLYSGILPDTTGRNKFLHMPDEELLYSTGWMFKDPLVQLAIIYCLDLMQDGSAALYSYIDGEMDYLEEYHGIWYCHVDGQFRYLNLSMERTGGALAQPDETPVVIMDTFPILVHLDDMSLVLGKGLYECALPFVTDGEITAVFLASAG